MMIILRIVFMFFFMIHTVIFNNLIGIFVVGAGVITGILFLLKSTIIPIPEALIISIVYVILYYLTKKLYDYGFNYFNKKDVKQTIHTYEDYLYCIKNTQIIADYSYFENWWIYLRMVQVLQLAIMLCVNYYLGVGFLMVFPIMSFVVIMIGFESHFKARFIIVKVRYIVENVLLLSPKIKCENVEYTIDYLKMIFIDEELGKRLECSTDTKFRLVQDFKR